MSQSKNPDEQPRPPYPHSPGYKVGGTSKKAADAVEPYVGTIKEKILRALKECGPMTADDCAAFLDISILSVRPRFTELLKLGLLKYVGEGVSSSGHAQDILGLADED